MDLMAWTGFHSSMEMFMHPLPFSLRQPAEVGAVPSCEESSVHGGSRPRSL